jgi:hypothetical protein
VRGFHAKCVTIARPAEGAFGFSPLLRFKTAGIGYAIGFIHTANQGVGF